VGLGGLGHDLAFLNSSGGLRTDSVDLDDIMERGLLSPVGYHTSLPLITSEQLVGVVYPSSGDADRWQAFGKGLVNTSEDVPASQGVFLGVGSGLAEKNLEHAPVSLPSGGPVGVMLGGGGLSNAVESSSTPRNKSLG